MLHQNWIVQGDVCLLSVHHSPKDVRMIGAVILLAGFSQPMCDVDYFMSKLARQLAGNGLFVAQVDPRGHGDSGCELANVDLDTLREDITIINQYYTQRLQKKLLFIGRGLIATLLAESSVVMNFLGVAGIAPYRLAPDVIKSLLRETNVNSNDAYQIFPGNDYVGLSDFSTLSLDTLDALGVVPYNIHGMRMSERILHQLSQYDLASALQQAKFGTNLWLNDSLTRTPAFQQSVISRLTQWAIERCASN